MLSQKNDKNMYDSNCHHCRVCLGKLGKLLTNLNLQRNRSVKRQTLAESLYCINDNGG